MASRSEKENALQRIGQLAPFGIGQLGEVALFPHDGGQMLGFRYPEKRPIRLAALEAGKEAPVIFRHVGDHRGDDRLPRGLKVRERDRFLSHAGEAPRELLAQRLAGRGENFGHRTVVTDDVDQKGAAQLVADALVCQEAAHVEEVARVLAVEAATILPA